ncbi:MAG: pentapeptide repeat-containing protein, partial [Actinobacteria bacterium]|nr:pentapeptide repeat-containing protein [Actinomycetota bacterium]
LRHVTFRECKLDFALLRFLHGDSVMFVDCILTGADLSGATLAGAEFERCDLVDVDLSYADLDGVDLRSSRLAPARGVGALRGAIVDAAQLGTLAPALAAEIGINVEAGDGAGSPARELRDT